MGKQKYSGNRTENRAKFPGCGKMNYNYIIFIVLVNTSARGPTNKLVLPKWQIL